MIYSMTLNSKSRYVLKCLYLTLLTAYFQQIENYKFVASYNWTKNDKPTIIVPGNKTCSIL